MPPQRVFMDFSVDSAPLGRVIFELHTDSAPKTAENFRALCTGEKGLSSSGIPLYYKNSIIHRSINNFMLQGGDFTKRNGTGGESIYGSTFADEDLTRPLDAKGLLCMANKGPDSNGSQFFITLRDCPHLNGKHVVFGKVIRGYEIVERICEVPVDEKDRPRSTVAITNCGELELKAKPPVKPKERSASISDEAKVRRERSPSLESSDSEKPRHRRKREKRSKRSKVATPELALDQPHKETEEEYDARLEREEIEREELKRVEQKKRELERIKMRYEADTQSTEGVRFKGRGRMKFVDPEVARGNN